MNQTEINRLRQMIREQEIYLEQLMTVKGNSNTKHLIAYNFQRLWAMKNKLP